jgi:site-specific DNA-cytosine methylase
MVPCLIKEWDNVEIGGNSKKYFNLHKPSLNKPCFTITETASTGAASVLHPLQKRKLNIEEVRLLSTFPKDYNFLDTNAISTMGRSVLPVMMANISNQIYLQWLND